MFMFRMGISYLAWGGSCLGLVKLRRSVLCICQVSRVTRNSVGMRRPEGIARQTSTQITARLYIKLDLRATDVVVLVASVVQGQEEEEEEEDTVG